MRDLTIIACSMALVAGLTLSACQDDTKPAGPGSGTKQPDGSAPKDAQPQQQEAPQTTGSGSR